MNGRRNQKPERNEVSKKQSSKYFKSFKMEKTMKVMD
jgi:hypothetical protein